FYEIVRRPRSSTLFPYTTLFRSRQRGPSARTSRSEADDARAHLTGARGGCDEDSSSRAEPHAAPDSGGVPVGKEIWKRAARHHRSEEHTSELQSRFDLVCRLLLE